jgi:hypothetical protein
MVCEADESGMGQQREFRGRRGAGPHEDLPLNTSSHDHSGVMENVVAEVPIGGETDVIAVVDH